MVVNLISSASVRNYEKQVKSTSQRRIGSTIITWNVCKAAPTSASNLCKLVCTNCLTTAADGTSMWRKPSGCSSYCVNFFTSFLEHALIELISWIKYIFSTFRYFSLYLFSNLAFCLLYSLWIYNIKTRIK